MKLVVNNSISVDYFTDYKKAVDFLCKAMPHKFKNLRAISQEGAIRIMNNLCDNHIEVTEKDNGKCLYRVRIKS